MNSDVSKKVLKLILQKGDIKVFNHIRGKVDYIFVDKNEHTLYTLLENYYTRYDVVPTVSVLSDIIKIDKISIRTTLKSVLDIKLLQKDEAIALCDYLLKESVLAEVKTLLTHSINLVKVEPSQLQEHIKTLGEKSFLFRNLLEKQTLKEGLIHGKLVEDTHLQNVRLNRIRGDTYVCNFGIQWLDDNFKGYKPSTMLSVPGFTNQGKSPFLRFLCYKALMQVKNCFFLTLEDTKEEVETMFYVLHANNVDRWGSNRLNKNRITFAKVDEGSLTDSEYDFYQEVVNDFVTSDTMGRVYIVQPQEIYTIEALFSTVQKVHREYMPVDLLFTDYLSKVAPSDNSYRLDASVINNMITKCRMWCLSFENGRGLPWVNAHQVNRKGFSDMLKHEANLYGMDAISDNHAVERESTLIFSVARPPEAQDGGYVFLQSLKARRGKFVLGNQKVYFDGSTGVFRDATGEEELGSADIQDLDIGGI